MAITASTLLLETTGLNGGEMLAYSSLILAASIIRGYAGFGFSAIVVAGASLFLPTREVVPLVLLLEIAASLQMARNVWRFVDWKMVLSILAGSMFFIPLGQSLLLWVAVEPMRVIAALLLLTAVVSLASGWSFPIKNEPKGWFLIGTISGFMNGLLAMGGLWIMSFLLGSGIKVATLRASLVALFFTTDSYALITGSLQGLVTKVVIVRFFWSLPILFIGIWLGSLKFEGTNASTYRKVALLVLAILALVLLSKSLFSISQS